MTVPPLARRTFVTAAAIGLADLALVACSKAKTPSAAGSAPAVNPTSSAPSSAPATSATPTPTPSKTKTTASGAPVHIRLLQNDGQTYGVGIPIIAYLSKAITDAKPFAAASKVTVNSQVVEGGWFFQKSSIYPDYPMEAHYRTQSFWPAHAAVNMAIRVAGLSAGTGLVFDDSLTLAMKTGARNITSVNGATERMTVTSDGKKVFDFPVSLGKASTPTFTGTKIVMEKDRVERMVGTTPGDSYDLQVPWSCRLTNSGEFIHAASWNGGNIGQRSTSNGCTNLNVDAAEQYFDFAQVGDVAQYTHTGGGVTPSWDGYGDWNLSWATWRKGGLLSA